MKKLEVKILKSDLSQHEFIYLVPLSDFHWDEPQCERDTIKAYVEWIKAHENAYIILNGDLVTAPMKETLYELGEPGKEITFLSLDQCTDELEALFQPVADRILACCSGGHELSRVFQQIGSDWTYNLMKRLGKESIYARDGGILLIKTKPLTPKDKIFFTIVFTHGWGTARTRGAKLRKIEYLSQAVDADVYVLSHDHVQNLTRDNVLFASSWDDERLSTHRKLLVSTGSFRGYAGYPLRRGFQPADLGTPRVRLGKRVDKEGNVRKDIHASL